MASSMKDLFGFIAKDDSLRTEGQILRLSLGLIEVKPQVRKHFDEEELKALAESIKAVGLQEPLTVMEEDPHSHKYPPDARCFPPAAPASSYCKPPVLHPNSIIIL